MAKVNDVSKTRRFGGGFTLIELLTVVTIILLLLSIAAPTVGTAIKVAKAAKCGSNLAQIGKAMSHFRSDKRMSQAMAPAGWQGALGPYLDGNQDVLVCPEFAGDAEQANVQAITELVYFRVGHGGGYDSVDLDENAYMVKLSDGQFNAARSAGWLGNANSANNFPRSQWPYAEDGSGVYWLCMEDYGGDWDYKDVMTKVTDNNDGTVTLDMFSGQTGHQNTLRWKDDDSLICEIKSNTPMGTLQHVLQVGACKTSYGMNSYAEATRFNGGRLLMIDYNWVVARPEADWDSYPGPSPGVPEFARHLGKLNVLLNGGNVMLLRPEEVDPVDQLIRASLWLD